MKDSPNHYHHHQKPTLNLIKTQIYLPIKRKFRQEKHIKHYHRNAINKLQKAGNSKETTVSSTSKLKKRRKKLHIKTSNKRHINQM